MTKSKETRGMIEHNSEVYNHPYISFFIVHVYMEEDLFFFFLLNKFVNSGYWQ